MSIPVHFFAVRDFPNLREETDRQRTSESHMPPCARCRQNDAKFATVNGKYVCATCLKDRDAVHHLNGAYFLLTKRMQKRSAQRDA